MTQQPGGPLDGGSDYFERDQIIRKAEEDISDYDVGDYGIPTLAPRGAAAKKPKSSIPRVDQLDMKNAGGDIRIRESRSSAGFPKKFAQEMQIDDLNDRSEIEIESERIVPGTKQGKGSAVNDPAENA